MILPEAGRAEGQRFLGPFWKCYPVTFFSKIKTSNWLHQLKWNYHCMPIFPQITFVPGHHLLWSEEIFLISHAGNCTIRVKIWSGSPVSWFQLSWLVHELIFLAAKLNLTYFEASGTDKDAGPLSLFRCSKKQLLCFRAEIHILWMQAHGPWPFISNIAAQGKAAFVQKLVWTKLRENNSEVEIS